MKNSFQTNPDFVAIMHKTVGLRTFVHFSSSTFYTSIALFVFLIPQLVMLALTGTISAFYVIGASILGVLFAEILNVILRKERFFGITSIVQGLLIGLLIPSNYPFIPVFFIAFIVFLLFKYVFGGYSHAWLNPVALTVVIAWMFDISQFPTFLLTRDLLLDHNPSLQLIQNGSIPILPFDTSITSVLNEKVFNIFGLSIPDGYVSLFWDSGSVIPAFRFNFITLISSAVLFAFDLLSLLIPFCYIIVYGVLVYFCSSFVSSEISGTGDVVLALMSSGTLFCALFLLPWFGTTPSSILCKICYGVIAGIIAFLIIGCGTSPVGSVFTVLVANLLSIILQQIEDFFARKKMKYLSKKEISVIMDDEK